MIYFLLYLLFTSVVFCRNQDTKKEQEQELELEDEKLMAKADPHDYYAFVGKCDPVLGKADASFYSNGVAGQGNFVYYRSNDIKGGLGCGLLNINADFNQRLYTIYNAKFLHGRTHTFKLHDYVKGVVSEDVPDPRNPGQVFQFKLVFLPYDSSNGVLAYIRCSDFGKRKKFIAYSVAIKQTVWKDPNAAERAKSAADNIVRNDGFDGKVSFVGTSKCP